VTERTVKSTQSCSHKWELKSDLSRRSSQRNAPSVEGTLVALPNSFVPPECALHLVSARSGGFGPKKGGLTPRTHTCAGGPVATRRGEGGEGGKRKVKFATFRDPIRLMRLVAFWLRHCRPPSSLGERLPDASCAPRHRITHRDVQLARYLDEAYADFERHPSPKRGSRCRRS
jgi:hypothetical protein